MVVSEDTGAPEHQRRKHGEQKQATATRSGSVGEVITSLPAWGGGGGGGGGGGARDERVTQGEVWRGARCATLA